MCTCHFCVHICYLTVGTCHFWYTLQMLYIWRVTLAQYVHCKMAHVMYMSPLLTILDQQIPRSVNSTNSAITHAICHNFTNYVQIRWHASCISQLYSPSTIRPGLDVNLETSTILTANCCCVSLCRHRLTTLNGPLYRQKITDGNITCQ